MNTPIEKRDSLGNIIYLLDSVIHRSDGPAIIRIDGTREYYVDGLLHRNPEYGIILPAIIKGDGTKLWYNKGMLHRDNGRPAILYPDGSGFHYVNGNIQGYTKVINGQKIYTSTDSEPSNHSRSRTRI